MRVDLHMHTAYSDGFCSPYEVAALAAQRKLVAWSITDHDTFAAYDALAADPDLAGSEILHNMILGVEVTTSYEGREVHIVSLGGKRSVLEPLLAENRTIRRRRVFGICQILQKQGCQLSMADVQEIAGISRCLSRQHVAAALRERGYIRYIQEAFDKYLGDVAMQQAAQDEVSMPQFPNTRDVIQSIQHAGGVAILAHPGIYKDVEEIDRYLDCGCDGVEINHPNLSPLYRTALEYRVKHNNLLASCGSDFHYPGKRNLGDWRLSRKTVGPLLERCAWGHSLFN